VVVVLAELEDDAVAEVLTELELDQELDQPGRWSRGPTAEGAAETAAAPKMAADRIVESMLWVSSE